MTTNLQPGSTEPSFQQFVIGSELSDMLQEGGGLFVVGQEDTSNIFLFEDGTNNIVIGGNELDFISLGDGSDNITGGAGDDFLLGREGDDVIRGGEGDDILTGNQGSDVLIGGEGSDIFALFANQLTAGETDVILDFEAGADSIVIIGSQDVSYESSTGLLSIDGLEAVSLQAGLDLDVVLGDISSVVFTNEVV